MDPQPEPRIPSPTLSDFGKGRFRRGRPAVLERYDGNSWRQAGRFGGAREANAALDEAVGAGADPASVRVVEIGPTPLARALMIAGMVVFGLVVAFCAYVVFG
jgi:hypothetical protein